MILINELKIIFINFKSPNKRRFIQKFISLKKMKGGSNMHKKENKIAKIFQILFMDHMNNMLKTFAYCKHFFRHF